MKKLITTLLISAICLSADIKLSQKLIDNDIDTDQYQLFITNTAGINIKGLEQKNVFNGRIEEYHKKYKQKSLPTNLQSYKEKIDEEVEYSLYAATILTLTRKAEVNDGEYIKVTDYFNNGILKTRLIKYIVSPDELDSEELELIYSTTDDTSYHYNEGQAHAMFTTKKELDKFTKEQKQ